MDLLETLRVALRALARNKMRSALTMLGIIIGVGAVIAMVGIGQGAREQVQREIAAMGSNLLFVGSGSVNRGGTRLGWGQTKSLVYADMQAILREVPTVVAAAPGANTTAQVVFGNDNWATQINGTEPQYFAIRNWDLSEGTVFTREDVEAAANVCVIGETVRKNLFGPIDPVGETIRIREQPFRVLGVLTTKGQSAHMGRDQDDVIFVPITTLQKKFTGQDWLQWIMVSSVSREMSYTTQRQIESLLRDRHQVRPEVGDDFFVRNLADMADLADQTGRIMTMLLSSVAGISLLVGGIGIMNIMLVSVTERTREIGIRMSIGATEQDVQSQFLIEAVVLSLMGGVAGVLFGVGASLVVGRLLGLAIPISAAAILVATLFAGFVGVFFGFYPARKAARLDPIEALRYE